MKARKSPAARTVLDRLVDEGIVDARGAKELRDFVMPVCDSALELATAIEPLQMLLAAILQPDRRDARDARRRDSAIAHLHAYYRGIGDDRATSRVAKEIGVTAKTVNNAVRSTGKPDLPAWILLANGVTDATARRSTGARKMLLAAAKDCPMPRPGNKTR